jgi:hypothetical protein
MLKGTFKVSNNLIKIKIHFMYFKTYNRPNLIKKLVHMIHFRVKFRLFDWGLYFWLKLYSSWTNILAKIPEKKGSFFL